VIGGPKGESLDLDVSLEGKGGVINMDGATLQIESDWRQGNGAFSGTVNGAMVNADIIPQALGYRLSSGALALELVILSPVRAALYSLMPIKQAPDLSKYLLSPMPGLLMRLSVSEGTAVKAGEELAVVEAMKMENVLRAERDGTVSKVCTSAGESLNLDQVILEFED
jgi:propionyl-CoA carboxylase alpha chain